MWYRPEIYDEDGVLSLVQEITYRSYDMTFMVRFFDGTYKKFFSEYLCPSIGLMQGECTNMQYLEAENWLNNNVSQYWKEIHE